MLNKLNKRNIIAISLAIATALAQVSVAGAAQPNQGTTATVQSCTPDSTGGFTVVYSTDGGLTTKTADLTQAEAQSAGLLDSTGNCTGTTFDLGLLPAESNPCDLPGDASQPVGEALTGFFCGSLGVDYPTIQSLHMDGFGYGLIAQACFMADALGGDASCQSVLNAKKTGDYSKLGLPDGSNVKNWGQLMKLVLADETKSLTNLGAIMSGRAVPPVATSTSTTTTGSNTVTTGNTSHGNSGNHGDNGNHGNGGGHGQSGNHKP